MQDSLFPIGSIGVVVDWGQACVVGVCPNNTSLTPLSAQIYLNLTGKSIISRRFSFWRADMGLEKNPLWRYNLKSKKPIEEIRIPFYD